MSQVAKKVSKLQGNPDHFMAQLNTAIERHDTTLFQKTLLKVACAQHGPTFVAQHAGIRRETLWRNKAGAGEAPLKTLIKILSLVGAKLVVVPDKGA